MPKSKTYEEFVEKFKPKRTTDDCYTPPEVYAEVLRFANEIADIKGRPVVRPFWPGGDFKSYDYPEGCVVIDNPPFSIYASIVRWYLANGIDFLLFAPTLTQAITGADVCYIISGANITYENGARIPTGFTTSLLPGLRVWVNGSIGKRIESLQKREKPKKTVKAYRWPDNATSIARLKKLSVHGVELKIQASECEYASKVGGIDVFGTGLLLSSKAAAEKAAAEKAAEKDLIPILLTDEEMGIIRRLDKR